MALEYHTITIIHLMLVMQLMWAWRPKKRGWAARRNEGRGGATRQWQAKMPEGCPECQAGVGLTIRAIRREAVPWRERKSSRGRKKSLATQGYACLNPDCEYHGITDEQVHALVGNGKRGRWGDIQTLKCQCCGSSFSTWRNTPLYYLKTHSERVELCLWLLAEGLYLSVLVRYTGHGDDTLARWLRRAGVHGEHLHALWLVNLQAAYLQLDELYAPAAGNKRKSWLWVAIEPVSKLIPAVYVGARQTEDGQRFVHRLKQHLAPGCVPAVTSDGLRAYFYALTGHFGEWSGRRWVVSKLLLYGQLIKRRSRRKEDGPYTLTRMRCGERWRLVERLGWGSRGSAS